MHYCFFYGWNECPSPNGFSRVFFSHCWDIVGQEVCQAVSYFFIHSHIELGLNSNLVVLIPKIPGASQIGKFRPIVLGNFIFKVITKILTDSLSLIAAKIIFQEQFGFIKG